MKKILVSFFSNESGWTFIETLIVIAIIIILTGSVGIMGIKYVDQAKIASAQNEISALSMAVESYYLDNYIYPTEEQGLAALWQKPVSEPVPDKWVSPYVNKNDFKDPWGHDYVYHQPGEMDLPFTIESYGSDNYPGGEGLNKDIKSWE